jgi:hypothetical protein
MRKIKGKAKTKGKTKSTSRPLVKRRGNRSSRDGQPLSFDLTAKDDMTVQTAAAPKQLVHDSINLVLAECDKVDAALVEITQDHNMPPLTIKQLEMANDGRIAKIGWAVVSADPHRPLTESDAKHIVAAMRRPRTSAPISIAAE